MDGFDPVLEIVFLPKVISLELRRVSVELWHREDSLQGDNGSPSPSPLNLGRVV